MTSRQIFNQTISLTAGDEADREDYAPFWHDVLNLLLAETFELNNALRECASKPKLTEIPQIVSFEQQVDCEPYVARAVLPAGAASYLLLEDEPGQAAYFSGVYRNMLSAGGGAVYADSMKSGDR